MHINAFPMSLKATFTLKAPGYTPLPNHPKHAACKTFHNVPQLHCSSVKSHTEMNEEAVFIR